MTHAWLGLAGPLVFVACAARAPAPPPLPPYTGPLDFPSEGMGDFFDRQKIVASYEGHTFGFDAVLQKRGHELTLLGLTPFGSRAFVVTQKDANVSFQAYVGFPMPFPPRYMLVDVHRVFFPQAPPDEGVTEGDRSFAHDNEIVTERWHEGRLLRRSFSRPDGHLPGTVVVDYDGGMGEGANARPHVVLTNGWYGYRLDITTLSHKGL